jgi:hypothetical protein
MHRSVLGVLVASAVAGCASTPDVTLNYYPAKWETTVTVTQTAGCSSDKKRLVINHLPGVTTAFSSILDKPFQIRLKDLDGSFADGDSTITFTDDGRLKSVNHETAGKGDAIVKSAVSLVTSFGGLAAFRDSDIAARCETIEKWGNNKPVTLTYRKTLDASLLGSRAVELEPAPESVGLANELKGFLPIPRAAITKEAGARIPSEFQSNLGADKLVMLELQKLGAILIIISNDDGVIGRSKVVVPEQETYLLPIPKAAMFGKQTFALTLSEEGAPTSIKYGKLNGAAGSLTALDDMVKSQGVTAKAVELKAETDLIIQQQRLVLCQTKPDQCK